MDGPFVVHYCLNEKTCNRAWIDKDLSNVHSYPPKKFCPLCVEKGIGENTKDPVKVHRAKIMQKARELKQLTHQELLNKVILNAKMVFGADTLKECKTVTEILAFLTREFSIPENKEFYIYCAYALQGMEETCPIQA